MWAHEPEVSLQAGCQPGLHLLPRHTICPHFDNYKYIWCFGSLDITPNPTCVPNNPFPKSSNLQIYGYFLYTLSDYLSNMFLLLCVCVCVRTVLDIQKNYEVSTKSFYIFIAYV